MGSASHEGNDRADLLRRCSPSDGGLAAACHRPIKSTLPAPPTRPQLAELWVEPPGATATCSGASAASGSRPIRRAVHRHRDQARRLQPRLHRHRIRKIASGAPSFRPRRRPKSSPRASTGASATTSRRSTTCTSGPPRRRPSPNPQLPARFREKSPELFAAASTTKAPGPTTRIRSSARGSSMACSSCRRCSATPISRTTTTRSTSSQKPLEGARTLVCGARPRAHVRPHRRARRRRAATRRSSRRRRSSRASSTASDPFEWRGRHDALFDDITPADVRWICERLCSADATAVAGCLQCGRLSAKPMRSASSAA